MPCHHKLEEFLDAYIKAAGIEGDRKDRCSGPLSARQRNSAGAQCRVRTAGTCAPPCFPMRELKPR